MSSLTKSYSAFFIVCRNIILTSLFTTTSLAIAGEGTYREALLNIKNQNYYFKALGESCTKKITDLYKQDRNLRSTYIVSKAQPLSAFKNKASKGYPFYHYTNDDNIKNAFSVLNEFTSSEGLQLIKNYFSSLRQGSNQRPLIMDGGSNKENTVFYVADTPYSSSHFGKNQITLWFEENSKVLFNFSFDKKSLKKIIEQDPHLDFLSKDCTAGVFMIVLEESDVDLFTFAGVSGIIPFWLHVVSPKNIISTNVFTLPIPIAEQESSDTASNRLDDYFIDNHRADEIRKR